jgi:hypothetical protein
VSATQSAWKAESGAVYSRLKWLSARRETRNTTAFVSRLAAHATGVFGGCLFVGAVGQGEAAMAGTW